MSSLMLGLVGLLVFLLLIFLRMPIAFAMALVGFAGFSYMTSASAAMNMVARELYSTFSSYSLQCYPHVCMDGFSGLLLRNWFPAVYFCLST